MYITIVKNKTPIRVMISIQPDVLKRLDNLAGNMGLTRSGTLRFIVEMATNPKMNELAEDTIKAVSRHIVKK